MIVKEHEKKCPGFISVTQVTGAVHPGRWYFPHFGVP